ncbi:helix-turn-helix transcriptional regulator [Ponticoccus sp. SC2-23]|uniref:helix-turn-helix transcriptional regulator n=1 Tax=Alexandriicola marinus TaxID=2081710 RepID=UPI000FDCDC3D|nr:LuxR C-terminal-related transcriptional regulator [Alexandriicola marinus]MBM1219276.1 helix-turn-helix transcriptional regulator [Ponticoccus sp. SC6-9]MBM1223652.1 helix-turn-helix transcriptional regulator [Ponticoccus sp. SC6-15]MBM1229089.1 helix-turn-helix transcriptional regulator [Ponticoccus sp. SC6-38]MBM1232618.1 helix-turn-helix transcriptional regulator [Ponticoccus sp. SC6-45]MBM1237432.1 helix-turn-helix transcriptional regulator [Ponticoccus sp. SC6-49]MBM1241629.1 helix-tu
MSESGTGGPLALSALIAAQGLCAAFFLWDVWGDGVSMGIKSLSDLHFVIEAVAAVALISAVIIEMRFLRGLLRRKAHLERQVSVAATAFHDIIENQFKDWGLTVSEADVAHFLVKGASIGDIARYRGSAEGTVKSHLNAIYRKAGVGNRGELLSLLIEDLVGLEETVPPASNTSTTA